MDTLELGIISPTWGFLHSALCLSQLWAAFLCPSAASQPQTGDLDLCHRWSWPPQRQSSPMIPDCPQEPLRMRTALRIWAHFCSCNPSKLTAKTVVVWVMWQLANFSELYNKCLRFILRHPKSGYLLSALGQFVFSQRKKTGK